MSNWWLIISLSLKLKVYPYCSLDMDVGVGEPFYLIGEANIKKYLRRKDDDYYYISSEGKSQKCVGVACAEVYLPRNNSLRNIPYLPQKEGSRIFYAECNFCLKYVKLDFYPTDPKIELSRLLSRSATQLSLAEIVGLFLGRLDTKSHFLCFQNQVKKRVQMS